MRWALVALALTLTGFDWLMRPTRDPYSLAIGVLHCVMIVAIGAFPRVGSLGVMMVEALCCLRLATEGPSRLWGDCLALGMLSYAEGTLSVVLLGTIGASLLQLLQSLSPQAADHRGLNPTGFTFLVSVILIAASLGYAFRRGADRKLADEREHAQTLRELEYDRQERQLRIAATMHDAVAGRLANIIMRTDSDATPTPNAWSTVHTEAQEALDELHAIITMLRQPIDDAQTTSTTPKNIFHQRLADLCAAQDRRMSGLGLHGEGVVKEWDPNGTPESDHIELACGLVGELYVNIGKYADRSTPYQLSITIDGGNLEIVQSNGISTPRKPSAGGRGLAIYAQRVAHAGGMVSYGTQSGEWSFYALIPLRGKAR